MNEFDARAFGYESMEEFMGVLRVPQCLRFEVRKHTAKVKHAQNRIREAEKVLANERELRIADARKLAIVEKWVQEHRSHLAYCERRLKFLSDASEGVVHEEGPGYQMEHQILPSYSEELGVEEEE